MYIVCDNDSLFKELQKNIYNEILNSIRFKSYIDNAKKHNYNYNTIFEEIKILEGIEIIIEKNNDDFDPELGITLIDKGKKIFTSSPIGYNIGGNSLFDAEAQLCQIFSFINLRNFIKFINLKNYNVD